MPKIVVMKNLIHLDSSEPIPVSCQNDLTAVHVSLSQCEYDILFYILYIFEDGKADYSFPVSDILKISGKDWHSSDLYRYTEDLLSRHVSMCEDIDEHWQHNNIFQSVGYRKGILSVSLTNFALPLFAHTKERFTEFELRSAFTLSSKYSKRLYWLLSQWKSVGSKDYDICELRELLGTDSPGSSKLSAYSLFADLRRMVKRCCDEITAVTDIKVGVEWYKRGRSYAIASFSIDKKQFVPVATLQDSPEFVAFEKLVNRWPYFTPEQIRQMWERGVREDRFEAKMKELTRYVGSHPGKIDNPKAFVVKCFAEAGFIKPACARPGDNDYLLQRKGVIDMIVKAVASGSPKEIFSEMMLRYAITDDELVS